MSRLHPSASRVERLAAETPAAYVAFDLLGVGDEDLRNEGFAARRRRLEEVLTATRPPILLTPLTRDVDAAAQWFERFRGGGIDGIVAKREDLPYEPGRRTMTKVKHERTADCVLAGVRLLAGEPRVSSLLLGLYDERDELRHVGVVTQLPQAMRRDLIPELAPLVVDIEQHPWRAGFSIGASPLGRLKGSASRWRPEMGLDWVPLRPERVVEVGFDQVDVDRFRHPARFRRWRPDRTAESCRLDQLATDPPDLGAIVAGGAALVQ
jgi:ATP-dependent DNA ligase